MSKYYLVVKNKTDNKFEIVKIKENEIYSNGTDHLERCFNLEKIDLFTSRFSCEKDLVNYLKSTSRISLDDCELFVVSRNGDKIKFLNCMYHFSDRVDLLRKIMISSDNNRLSDNSRDVTMLLDDFIYNIFNNDRFYRLVVYGYTDIYKKFIDYVKAKNVALNELYFAKYRDGRWAMTAYNLHRSIMDAYNLYNQTYKSRDMYLEANKIRNDNKTNRESIINEIKTYTDKDYVDGQISMFDTDFVFTETDEVNSSCVKEAEISKDSLSHDDKIVEVLTFLDYFPRGMFVGDNLEFNPKIFTECDVTGLNKISIRLKRLINSYTVVKFHYDNAVEYHNNTRELGKDLDYYKKAILKLLEKDTILDKFYDFCMLYDKIKTEYESKVKEGKVYGKREDN